MTLKLKTKSVRFELADEDAETVVTLSSEDDEATLVRKLGKILALVEDSELGRRAPRTRPETPEDQSVWSPPRVGPPENPTNGWAQVYGPPELPEDRKGEWELVQPGEDT